MIKNYKDLNVYQRAMDLTMRIFERTKSFPIEERYSLTDQVRRSSRSVCTNLGEAWRKRRYRAAFISKLSDAEAEACETQIWIEIALRCGYINKKEARELDDECDHLMSQIVSMMNQVEKWLIRSK